MLGFLFSADWEMRQHPVKEGLLLFESGSVRGHPSEILAFEWIRLIVVEFGGLCPVAKHGHVSTQIGGPPLAVAVAGCADGPAHCSILTFSVAHLRERSLVREPVFAAHEWNQAFALYVGWNWEAGEFAEGGIHIQKLGEGERPHSTGKPRS